MCWVLVQALDGWSEGTVPGLAQDADKWMERDRSDKGGGASSDKESLHMWCGRWDRDMDISGEGE